MPAAVNRALQRSNLLSELQVWSLVIFLSRLSSSYHWCKNDTRSFPSHREYLYNISVFLVYIVADVRACVCLTILSSDKSSWDDEIFFNRQIHCVYVCLFVCLRSCEAKNGGSHENMFRSHFTLEFKERHSILKRFVAPLRFLHWCEVMFFPYRKTHELYEKPWWYFVHTRWHFFHMGSFGVSQKIHTKRFQTCMRFCTSDI